MKKNKAGIIQSYVWIAICVAGFIINFITYYPGFMTPDSLSQFEQSITQQYESWHPPFMAFVWHLLDIFYKGPQVMLALQLLLLWCSCYVFAKSVENIFGKLFIMFAFFFMPFLQNYAGYVIKDSLMTLSWLLAIAILYKYSADKRRTFFFAFFSALLLLSGAWVRYNALTGLLPLCFVWSWVIFTDKKKIVKWIAAISLFLIIIGGNKLFIDKVIKPVKTYPELPIYMSDLTACFIQTHKNVYPELLYENPNFDTNYIRANYDPARIDNLIWCDKNLIVRNKATAEALKTAWIQTIIESPGSYIKNRYIQFLYFAHIKEKNESAYFVPWVLPNTYGFHVNENSKFYRGFTKYMRAQKNYFYFKPLFWILLNIALFALIPFIKDETGNIYFTGLITSSLLYLVPMFFLVTTDADFRYLYWGCIACTAALLISVHSFLKKR